MPLAIKLCGPSLYFAPEAKRNSKKPRIWHINQAIVGLGPQLCKVLPFLHALLGCDTTSRLFGIGKGVGLKLLSNKSFYSQAEIFMKAGATAADVTAAGEIAMCRIYGHSENDLNALRYHRFCEKVAKSTKHVELQSLPPTSSSAKYHSLRVYHQIQMWLGDMELDPSQWGWKVKKDGLIPIESDMPAAPKYLLETIACNCKSDCVTSRCTCKKNGLKCSVASGVCKGISCRNVEEFEGEDFKQSVVEEIE